MAYSTRPYSAGYSSSGYFTKGIKWLLITNITIFVIYFLAVQQLQLGWLFEPFNLVPRDVVTRGYVWQLVSYMFLHDPFGFFHILFNMLTLWMFGADLERTWGTRTFLRYYFGCGIGAGICVVLLNYLIGDPNTHTIGASGAIFGLLLAFGMLFPDREILFMLMFPVKAKYAVMIMGGIAFLSTLSPRGGAVSHIAHLGGMLVGFIFLRTGWHLASRRRTSPRRSFMRSLEDRWKDYKLRRAKRKFQVYLKKQQDPDRWVH